MDAEVPPVEASSQRDGEDRSDTPMPDAPIQEDGKLDVDIPAGDEPAAEEAQVSAEEQQAPAPAVLDSRLPSDGIPWAPIEVDNTIATDEEVLKELGESQLRTTSALDEDVWRSDEFMKADQRSSSVHTSVHWKIPKFRGSKEDPNKDLVMRSDLVEAGGLQWRLKAYPRGSYSDDYLALYLECPSMSKDDSETHYKDEAVYRDETTSPLPVYDQNSFRVPKAVYVRMYLIIYNPADPRVTYFRNFVHVFHAKSTDGGFSRFGPCFHRIGQRQLGQQQALLRNDELGIVAYIHLNRSGSDLSKIFSEERKQGFQWYMNSSNWSTFDLHGFNTLSEPRSRDQRNGNLMSALAVWLMLEPFRKIIYSIDVADPRGEVGRWPTPLITALQRVLLLMRRPSHVPNFSVSLDIVREALLWHSVSIDPSMDVFQVWHRLLNILEKEIRYTHKAGVFEDLFTPHGFRVRARVKGSQQDYLTARVDPKTRSLEFSNAVDRQSCCPKILQISQSSSYFDTGSKLWVKFGKRLEYPEICSCSTCGHKYRLLGTVFDNGKNNVSVKHAAAIRTKEGRWHCFLDSRHNGQDDLNVAFDSRPPTSGEWRRSYATVYVRQDVSEEVSSPETTYQPPEWLLGDTDTILKVDPTDLCFSGFNPLPVVPTEDLPTTEEVSANMENVPTNTDDTPTNTDDTPTNMDDVPASTDNVLTNMDGDSNDTDNGLEEMAEQAKDVETRMTVETDIHARVISPAHQDSTLLTRPEIAVGEVLFTCIISDSFEGHEEPGFVNVPKLIASAKETQIFQLLFSSASEARPKDILRHLKNLDIGPWHQHSEWQVWVLDPTHGICNSPSLCLELTDESTMNLDEIVQKWPGCFLYCHPYSMAQPERLAKAVEEALQETLAKPTEQESEDQDEWAKAEAHDSAAHSPLVFLKYFDITNQKLTGLGAHAFHAPKSDERLPIHEVVFPRKRTQDGEAKTNYRRYFEQDSTSYLATDGNPQYMLTGSILIVEPRLPNIISKKQGESLSCPSSIGGLEDSEKFVPLLYSTFNEVNGPFSSVSASGCRSSVIEDKSVPCAMEDFYNEDAHFGAIVNDRYVGHGLHAYRNGNVYRGHFRGKKRHGQGVFDFADGSKYDGSWSEDDMSGHGVLTKPSGNKFTGEFKPGCHLPTGDWTIKSLDEFTKTCLICWENEQNCAFRDCGHVCACYDCATKLRNELGPCPLCRKKIEQDPLRLYFASQSHGVL